MGDIQHVATTDKSRANEIIERWKQLDSERVSWVEEWKLISKYVFPRRSVFTDSRGKAERVGQSVYDGTAIGALNLFANGIMGYAVTAMTPWFKTGLPWTAANELPGVRAWLDFGEKVMYDDFRRGNWYEEAVEIMKDGGSMGTAVLYGEEDEDSGAPMFRAIHPKEFYIDTDQYGRVNTVYRRFWSTVRTLVAQFGLENLSAQTQSLYQAATLDQKIEILHSCEPREDRDITSVAATDKKWASTYTEKANAHIIRESGYDIFPYFTLRISTNSDEKYGRGPGSDSLVDTIRINRISKDMLKISNRAADPPYNVPMEMRNRVDRRPAGNNYYTRPDMKMEPVPSPTAYPIAIDQENQIRKAIEENFFVDFWLMLQRSGAQKMTATEVMERQAEKAAVMGTLIGRIESDLLDPVIQFVFAMAVKANRIPPPPPALLIWMQRNGKTKGTLKIEYIGPLAQAQRKFYLTQGIKAALAAVIPYAQVRPEILDNFNWDAVAREIAEAEGMPARLITDPEIVKAIRDARMQAQQAAAQENRELQGAEAYSKMKDSPGKGSPAAKAMESGAAAGTAEAERAAA